MKTSLSLKPLNNTYPQICKKTPRDTLVLGAMAGRRGHSNNWSIANCTTDSYSSKAMDTE